MPLVSVLIPVLNGAETIARAIVSLQAQTLLDFEALIVDDGSTDKTQDIVMAFAAQDPRIRYKKLDRNYGVSHARNVALEMAQGEWVTLLDGDDWFEADRLDLLVRAAHDLQADVVADNLKIYDHVQAKIVDQTQFSSDIKPERLTPEAVFDRDTPLAKYAIGYAQPLVRLSYLQAAGIHYREEYRLNEDFLFLSELVLKGGAAYLLAFAAYTYVHRLSPTNAAVSPFSRSGEGYSQAIAACDDLLKIYGGVMSAKAKRALARRKRLFEVLSFGRELKTKVNGHRWREFICTMFGHPLYSAEICRILWSKWLRRFIVLIFINY